MDNRLTASGVSGSIEHNQNNELRLYGDISFEYNDNGNLVSKTSASESWAYTYNVQNRLVQVEEDDLLIAEYGYDPFGRRLWKEVDGERTYFLYSDEGLVAEYDESGEEIRSYGYKPDSTWGTDPLWLKEDGEYYWYQNDHLGTPQKLIDSTGTVVWSAQYTTFGEADVQVETIVNNLRFPGQYADDETGLHYNYFRYYDPKLGRYLKEDPIGFLGGDINLYAYVQNNPVTFIDPKGLLDAEVMKIVIPIIVAIPDPSDAVTALFVVPVGIGYVLSKFPGDDSGYYPPVIPVPAPTPGQICDIPPIVSSPPITITVPIPTAVPLPPPLPMAARGKNDPHANQKAKEAAKKAYEELKKKFEELRSKPNKTPEDKKLLEKMRKLLKRLKEKMDWTGETHHRR